MFASSLCLSLRACWKWEVTEQLLKYYYRIPGDLKKSELYDILEKK